MGIFSTLRLYPVVAKNAFYLALFGLKRWPTTFAVRPCHPQSRRTAAVCMNVPTANNEGVNHSATARRKAYRECFLNLIVKRGEERLTHPVNNWNGFCKLICQPHNISSDYATVQTRFIPQAPFPQDPPRAENSREHRKHLPAPRLVPAPGGLRVKTGCGRFVRQFRSHAT